MPSGDAGLAVLGKFGEDAAIGEGAVGRNVIGADVLVVSGVGDVEGVFVGGEGEAVGVLEGGRLKDPTIGRYAVDEVFV